MTWECFKSTQRQLFTNGDVGFYMIKVPNTDYYIGETPITQKLWTSVMGNNPSHFTDSILAPVESISHRDCLLFIEKLNNLTNVHFRLPSIKEWLLAARGGDDSQRFVFAGSNNADEVGWFDKRTHPVRLKKPNSIGLFDMCGNVWEWCSDVAPVKYVFPGTDSPAEYIKKPNGEIEIPTFYYLTGGSCMNSARNSTLLSLNSFGEYYRNFHIGMRLVLN